jgi:hypothetical protein
MKKIILVLLMLTLSFSAFSQQKADYEDDGGIDQTLVLLTGVVLAIPRLHVDFFEMLADSFTKDHYIRTFSKTYPKARSQYNLCENRCQSPHGLLSLGFQKMQPAYGNLLDFLNEKKDFADHIQRTVGYCWGHTSTTRKFNYLAVFDPFERYEKLPRFAYKSQKRAYFKHKINRVMRNQATIFPGYSNLREFSRDEEMKHLLKDKVVWQWMNNAIRVKSIPASAKGIFGRMKASQFNLFFNQVKRKLRNFHTPKIIFTNLKRPAFIHVVSVYDTRETRTHKKLCLLDNHEYEKDLRDCGRYVLIDKSDYSYSYSGWDDPARDLEPMVGQFSFAPEDDVEVYKFYRSLRRLCERVCL